MMDYRYGDHMSGWGLAATGIGSVLLWVALVLGTVALTRHLRVSPSASSAQPEQLLAGRYARGEIDDDEYVRRSETLRRVSSVTGISG